MLNRRGLWLFDIQNSVESGIDSTTVHEKWNNLQILFM